MVVLGLEKLVVRAAPVVLVGLLGCRSTEEQPVEPPSAVDFALAELLAFERAERAAANFLDSANAQDGLGPDPYEIVPVAGGFVGVLRGANRVVLLDATLEERERAATPPSPTGVIAVGSTVYVVAESTGQVRRFTVTLENGESALDEMAPLNSPFPALRDIARIGDRLVVLGPNGSLAISDAARTELIASSVRVGRGAISLTESNDRGALVSLSLLDHRATVLSTRQDELVACATFESKGPLWSAALAKPKDDGPAWLALGGVENHDLDRSDGSFGYIDSFVFLMEVDLSACGDEPVPKLDPARELNVADHGVVTPKYLRWVFSFGSPGLQVFGYGSALALGFGFQPSAEPFSGTGASTHWIVPGVQQSSEPGSVVASPLLDAWVDLRELTPRVVAIPEADLPSREIRLGEALAFTTLMAPNNPSSGSASRFTCETCHFEGTVDGRTHHTGRGDIFATTKPLLGLFNNAPHFTRALDPTMTEMVHAEFAVAGKASDTDPWFSTTVKQQPWLTHIGYEADETLGPAELRKALMVFLMRFQHRPNWSAQKEGAFDVQAQAGAQVFNEHCIDCHAARAITDDSTTSIPMADWEKLITSPSAAAPVWAREGYEKTGVLPYVHPDGARTPSLRRVSRKAPYFTNGSAEDLDDVLQTVRVGKAGVVHDPSAAGSDARSLTTDEQTRLRAFLELL